MRDSISQFMSHVHRSVNEISQQFLVNEKRYNYTTPKSFLEQITLYQNLLSKKNNELQAKIVRLENGLEKLRSTASQVPVTLSMTMTTVFKMKMIMMMIRTIISMMMMVVVVVVSATTTVMIMMIMIIGT